MKPTWVRSGAAVALLVGLAGLSGCELEEQGGGGGIGVSGFSQGFVFVRADDRNIYASDRSTGYSEVGRLTRNGNNKHPSLSPDGRQVVFVNQNGSSSALMAVNLAGGEPRTVLTSDGTLGRLAGPVFAPDGQRVVFTFERGGLSVLAVIGVDGTGLQELSTGSLSYLSPSFYPDGEQVLVAAGNLSTGLTQLERVNVTTGARANVLNGLGNEAVAIRNRVVLSKDGTRAAFDGQLASGATRIFVVALSSGAPVQLTHYPADPNANDSFPSWVGNTEVAFSSDTGGNDQVYVLPAAAQKQQGSLRLPSAVEAWFGPN